MTAEVDFQVRREVYDVAMRRGYPPKIAEISAALKLAADQVQASLQRLSAGHVLVLQPGSGEVLMANPFSAVPTPFEVQTPTYACYGNCIWDALGIAVVLRQDVSIKTACGDCGAALELRVAGGGVHGDQSVVHFAVPAHQWWDDIVFS